MNLLQESIPPRFADARETLTVEAFAREIHMEGLGNPPNRAENPSNVGIR